MVCTLKKYEYDASNEIYYSNTSNTLEFPYITIDTTPKFVCGDDTHMENNECVSSIPETTCGPGTQRHNDACVPHFPCNTVDGIESERIAIAHRSKDFSRDSYKLVGLKYIRRDETKGFNEESCLESSDFTFNKIPKENEVCWKKSSRGSFPKKQTLAQCKLSGLKMHDYDTHPFLKAAISHEEDGTCTYYTYDAECSQNNDDSSGDFYKIPSVTPVHYDFMTITKDSLTGADNLNFDNENRKLAFDIYQHCASSQYWQPDGFKKDIFEACLKDFKVDQLK
tara:strand:+ start:581 stop:1423 length:843 start_codon:yes stop_codon:yes gene_type:complete